MSEEEKKMAQVYQVYNAIQATNHCTKVCKTLLVEELTNENELCLRQCGLTFAAVFDAQNQMLKEMIESSNNDNYQE